MQDDPRLTNYNVKSRVDDFVAAATALSNMTQGEHVMFTMGSDFQYEAVSMHPACSPMHLGRSPTHLGRSPTYTH